MKPSLPTTLSSSDTKILSTVFDPESSPQTPNITIDPSLPTDPHITNPSLLRTLRAQELTAIKLVETCPSDADDAQKYTIYEHALGMLSAIIANNPSYSSAWNNRAQLRRWRWGDRHVLTSSSTSFSSSSSSSSSPDARLAIASALQDLETAISLASPGSSFSAVSPAQGRLLAQAWTQRAAIFYGAAKDLSAPGEFCVVPGEEEWSTWGRARFEEEGSRCFYLAGLYGSEVGRAMAVLSNPTAKLCGGIVREAMRRERCGS